MSFKVIIAGSRTMHFADYRKMVAKLNTYLANKDKHTIQVVSGTARGADQLGEEYAKQEGFDLVRCPADWKKLGKRAGYVRNQHMAQYADAAIIFWDGKSKGTKHMIDIMHDAKKPYKVVRIDQW